MKTILHGIEIDEMVQGYLTCALFTDEPEETQENGEFYQKPNWNLSMFDKDAVERAVKDCGEFFKTAFKQDLRTTKSSEKFREFLGINFWYSRNGHGAGFFDSNETIPNDTARDRLQTLAENMGQVWVDWYGESEATEFPLYINGDEVAIQTSESSPTKNSKICIYGTDVSSTDL